jgi:hypothetical protein
MEIKPISGAAKIGVLIMFIAPRLAHADAGIPIIMISYPFVLLGLVPVIFIEGFVLHKLLNFELKRSLKLAAISNSISTIAGFPLMWTLLFGIQIIDGGASCGPGFDTAWKTLATILLESAWICPWEQQAWFLIPVVFCVELFCAFIVSVYIERFILMKVIKDKTKQEITDANQSANIWSYLFLIALTAVLFSYELYEHFHK